MTDFLGHIWVAQDNDTIHLVCVAKQAKNKLQVLNEKGREQRLIEDKLLWRYPKQIEKPEDWQSTLATIRAEVEACTKVIDIPLLWESATELAISEIDDLTNLYFGGDITIEQKVAIWNALALDRLYFKRRGHAWEPRSASQIEELKTQREREQEREYVQERVTQWLKQISKMPLPTATAESEWVGIPVELTAFVDQLEVWLRGDADKTVTELVTPFADQLKISSRELVFETLQKIGRLPLDADRDVIIAGLKPDFSANVTETAQKVLPWGPSDTQTVVPLQFSIDDEETREVDDALSIEPAENGWKITIAIADPTVLIHPGDVIDREAMRRGTTVYLPTQTVLMLPERISCDVASLTVGEIRSSIVIHAELNNEGQLLESQIRREAICVQRRLNYREADELITTGQDETAQQLRALSKLAIQLQRQRFANGGFTLQRPEYKVSICEGDISVTMINHHSPSRLLVAEMMILANYIAAKYGQHHQVPLIYRTQENPLEPITMAMIEGDPLSFHKLRKFLRSSALSLEPGGHSGLGLSVYTQLTSPLRRFADLVMQRQLVAQLVNEPLPYNQQELYAVLETAERTARDSRRIENEAKKRWFLGYLKQKWQDRPLPALIIEPLKGGYRVEILPWGVDAFLTCNESFEIGTQVMTVTDKIRVRALYTRLRLIGR